MFSAALRSLILFVMLAAQGSPGIAQVAVGPEASTAIAVADPDFDSAWTHLDGFGAQIELGPGCIQIGGAVAQFTRASAIRGNVYRITQTATLTEIMMQMTVATPTPLHVGVYRRPSASTEAWVRYPDPAGDDVIIAEPVAGDLAWQTTGLLDPPLVLEAGFDYLIGFAWGAVDISFARDSETYPSATPIDFSFGQVRGLFGLNAIAFQADGQLADQFSNAEIPVFNLAAHSMQVCAATGGFLLNDECANATPVTDGTYAFDTAGASTDGLPHPQQCSLGTGYSDIGSDIWFAYTASCSGELTVDLCDSDYDTKVAVYSGCGSCPPNADPVACNDDYCFVRSYLTVPVIMGSCYTIRVGGYQSAQGPGILTLQCNEGPVTGACCIAGACDSPVEDPDCAALGGTWHEGEDCETFACPIIVPAHDECENCIPLETGVPFTGSTVGSTGADVSTCTVNDTNDVWHCWTADCSGYVTFETCGGPDPTFDTSLSVFDGCEGQEIACGDDGCGVQSRVHNVPVTEGTTYYLRVAGYGGDVGEYRILVSACRTSCCLDGACFGGIPIPNCIDAGGTPLEAGITCDDPDLCCAADDAPCQDDGIACTDDLCIANRCTHEASPAGAACPEDGDACTQDLCDGNAECTHNDSGLCGACCVSEDSCLDDLLPDACEGLGGRFLGANYSCLGDADDDGVDDACEFFDVIPTVSEWGLVVLALALLVLVKLAHRRVPAGSI
jgi:hypothetical protein